MNALLVPALELPGGADERVALLGLVAAVAAVVLAVALPPEGHALEGRLADEHGGGAVGRAAEAVGGEDEALRAGALLGGAADGGAGGEEAEGLAAAVVLAGVRGGRRLAAGVEDLWNRRGEYRFLAAKKLSGTITLGDRF